MRLQSHIRFPFAGSTCRAKARVIATADEAGFTTTTRGRGIGYQEALQRRGLAAPELIYLLDRQSRLSPVDYFLGLEDPASVGDAPGWSGGHAVGPVRPGRASTWDLGTGDAWDPRPGYSEVPGSRTGGAAASQTPI